MPSSPVLPRVAAAVALAMSLVVFGAVSGAYAETSTQPMNAPGMEQSGPQGLWLTTDFPELAEDVGHEARIPLVLRNGSLPPERVELAVEGLPDGWSWKILGGSSEISAAMVGPDQSLELMLVVTPPEDAEAGDVNFTVVGQARSEKLTLPMTVSLTPPDPAQLVMTAELPALRGTPTSSFDFQVSIQNDSPADATVNLVAQAPDGFIVTFKEQYGSQELTSLPVKAGETKKVKVSVQPPRDAAANNYPVMVLAATGDLSAQQALLLQVSGRPELSLAGPGGILSGEATAGQAATFNFEITNNGSAPARDVKLTASSPSGWKVVFNPETLAGVAPNEHQQVRAEITPSDKAITGDYMVTIRANGDGVSDSAQFRITVATSTAWGIAGLGIIGAAVVVLGVSVARYGRR